MTARSWRYIGSGAVMISALVAGSAWMKPPVDGLAAALTGLVDWVEAPLLPFWPAIVPSPPPLAAVLLPRPPAPDRPPAAPAPPPLPPALKAARSTVASRVASAFFR